MTVDGESSRERSARRAVRARSNAKLPWVVIPLAIVAVFVVAFALKALL